MPDSETLSDVDRELLEAAEVYRERAHAPISNYQVGAALLGETDDGPAIFGGCNFEHIVLGLSCCAEQVALHTAIAEGVRKFTTVAVFTTSSPPAAPCGSCRQALSAWGVERVVMGNDKGEVVIVPFSALLPYAFDLKGPVQP